MCQHKLVAQIEPFFLELILVKVLWESGVKMIGQSLSSILPVRLPIHICTHFDLFD